MPFVPAKCTQCGANIEVDSSKDAGICKYCGTAFITEKAINNYNITVTNNYDGANINIIGGNIDNLLTLAQAAIDASNFKEAYGYSNRVLEIDPSSVKAWLLKMQATGGIGAEEGPKTNEILNYGQKAISLSDEANQTNIEDEVNFYWVKLANIFMANAISKIDYARNQPYKCSYNQKGEVTHVDAIDNNLHNLITNLSRSAITLALTVPTSYCSTHIDLSDEYIPLTNQYLQYHEDYFNACAGDPRWPRKYLGEYNTPEAFAARQSTLDSLKARIPKDKHAKISGPKLRKVGGACYIATAVYGSYNCPEVWTLRRFRDYYLDKHSLGRMFIKCYYAISPYLVSTFGKTIWFKNIFRTLLDYFILKLKAMDYKDTPYHDKY